MSETTNLTVSFSTAWPHCDQKVLHAPGECVYCDKCPALQNIRKAWGISFTGHTMDGTGQACPAEYGRNLDVIYRWGGNKPLPPIDRWVRKAVAEIMELKLLDPQWADDAAKIIAEAARTR